VALSATFRSAMSAFAATVVFTVTLVLLPGAGSLVPVETSAVLLRTVPLGTLLLTVAVIVITGVAPATTVPRESGVA